MMSVCATSRWIPSHHKRLLPWLAGLFCALALLVLPGRADAAITTVEVATGPNAYYTLQDGMRCFRNDGTCFDDPNGDWNLFFEADKQILHMRDLVIDGSYFQFSDKYTDTFFGLHVSDNNTTPLTLDLQGTNVITIVHPQKDYSRALFLDCTVTVQGTGTLTAVADSADVESSGLYFYQLTQDSGTLIGTGGLSAKASLGVFARTSAVFNGGTVTGAGAQAKESLGVSSENELFFRGGAVTGTGAQAQDASMGIYAKEITVADGTVVGTGGPSQRASYGLLASVTATVSGGSLRGVAGQAPTHRGVSQVSSGDIALSAPLYGWSGATQAEALSAGPKSTLDQTQPYSVTGNAYQLTTNDSEPVLGATVYPPGVQVPLRALVPAPVRWAAQPSVDITQDVTDPLLASFVMPGENVSVTAQHQPTPTPKPVPAPPRTGDATPLWGAFGLGALSLMAFAGLCLRLRKQRRAGR